MNFFSGMAAGFGEAQGQHNQKMLDFLNQKSQTMAQLYGHLADTVIQSGGDQDIAGEFVNRAKGWASANPLLDPKGYSQLIKQEKSGLHDIVDRSTQQNIANYNNQTYGGQSSGSQASPFTFPQTQGAAQGGQAPSTQSATTGSFGGGAGSATPITQPNTAAGPGATSLTQGPSFGGGTSAPMGAGGGGVSPFQMPSINDMMGQLTGGQPIFGSLGVPTPTGRMAMSVAPEVMKQRMEMQYKWNLMQDMINRQGLDWRSPTGYAALSEMGRAMGINFPVPNMFPENVQVQDQDGQPKNIRVVTNRRDASSWVKQPDGKEVEVFPNWSHPQVRVEADGSVWGLGGQGANQLGGQVPIAVGQTSSQTPTPGGGVAKQEEKKFTRGHGAPPPNTGGAANVVPLPGQPTVGTVLPPGLNSGAAAGPPAGRTSTAKPSEAYGSGGGGFSLEKLEQSQDPVDQQVASYITHPESFLESGPRKEMWDMKFAQRTNGAVVQAPVPLRVLGTKFQDQRNAIVNGFEASKNVGNILSSSDGRIVGMVAGRLYEMLNAAGSVGGMKLLDAFESGRADLPQGMADQAFASLAKERPELAHLAQAGRGNELAMKAADLITTMRLFNFADVRNTIGGVQGVSRVYQFLKSSLMNPGMDLPLVLSHLSSLNRNMADGLLTLENARWGPKIPYIREKSLMSQLYFDSHVEGKIKAAQSDLAAKGVNLSREDAIFLLWRNGKIDADPGNHVDLGGGKGSE